jgi:hypothetical protein
MNQTFSARGHTLLGAVRRNFDLLVEHEKTSPAEVAAIVDAMVAHLRSWKPQALLVVQEGSKAGG